MIPLVLNSLVVELGCALGALSQVTSLTSSQAPTAYRSLLVLRHLTPGHTLKGIPLGVLPCSREQWIIVSITHLYTYRIGLHTLVIGLLLLVAVNPCCLYARVRHRLNRGLFWHPCPRPPYPLRRTAERLGVRCVVALPLEVGLAPALALVAPEE